MSAKPASAQKIRDIALAKATEAIKNVCRETEEGTGGAKVISDLATWEIEARLIDAVTKALKD